MIQHGAFRIPRCRFGVVLSISIVRSYRIRNSRTFRKDGIDDRNSCLDGDGRKVASNRRNCQSINNILLLQRFNFGRSLLKSRL